MLMPVRSWVPALLLLAAMVSAAPVNAQQTQAPAPCSAPVDPGQAKQDDAGVAAARSGGLDLHVVLQCAGFSVVVQDGIDDAVGDDYARQAERAYVRLAEETGEKLSPRAVLFAFVNQDG